jgi:hypothetical protein
MSQDEATFQIFNLETMSGVHPGRRTAVVQHIRLLPLNEDKIPQWARLLWYLGPPSCDLHLQSAPPELWQEKPLLRLENPLSANFGHLLQEALATAGWQASACGTCHHWQPIIDSVNIDGIPLGRCGWDPLTARTFEIQEMEMPEMLRRQSLLALACPAWEHREGDAIPAAIPPDEERSSQVTPASLTPWERLKQRILQIRPRPPRPSWGERIVERSGVGAGTEPCAACQGRIANLGALVVATEEGDRRTFSVWRCRHCHSFYLNDWVDRWERLDSLETEESYYRLSPVEAVALLALFEGVDGGEHPGKRHLRNEQSAQVEAYIRQRPRLSHQIRHGR